TRKRTASSGEPRGVLSLVELAETVGALDRLPPVAIVAVPVDRRPDAVLPLSPRCPAERAQLRRVERVAAVVPGPVLDVSDQRRVGVEMIHDQAGELCGLVLF